MSLRDNAIVAYAETKVMEKSDRNVWVLSGEILEAHAEGHAAVPRHDHRVQPDMFGQRPTVDLGHLHGIGVDVENVIVLMLIDDRPFFDRTEAHPLIDPIRIKTLAVDQEPEFLPMLRRLDFGMRRREFEHTSPGDFLVTDGLLRRRREFPRQLHRARLALDDDAGDRAGRGGIALIVRDCAQGVGARRAGLHQHVHPLTRRHQHGVGMRRGLFRIHREGQVHPRQGTAVEGDRMQIVSLQLHEDVVLPARMQQAPALHFARPHRDGRLAYAVDGQEPGRRLRKQRLEILDRPKRVEHRFGQH